MTSLEGRDPRKLQGQGTNLTPAYEAFGASSPFSPERTEEGLALGFKTDVLKAATPESKGQPVEGSRTGRIFTRLGLGSGSRENMEYTAARPGSGTVAGTPRGEEKTTGGQEPRKGMSRRTFLKYLATGLGVAAAGGGVGTFFATRGRGESAQSAKPTPETTPIGSGAITPTPETPTLTPTPTNTPEPTPTPTPEIVRSLEEQLGYKLYPESIVEYKGKYITIHLGVDQDVVDNTTCTVPLDGTIPCPPIKKFYLSSEYIKEKGGIEMTEEQMIEAFEDAVLTGHLINLKTNEKYANWTLDDLKERIRRIKNGEKLEVPTYKVVGGYNGPSIGMPPGIEVDVTKDVYFHQVYNYALTVKLNSNASMGYKRLDDGSYVIESWSSRDRLGARADDFFRYASPAYNIGISLALAKYGQLHGSGQYVGLTPYVNEAGEDAKQIYKLLLPIYDEETLNIVGIFKVDY